MPAEELAMQVELLQAQDARHRREGAGEPAFVQDIGGGPSSHRGLGEASGPVPETSPRHGDALYGILEGSVCFKLELDEKRRPIHQCQIHIIPHESPST